MTAVLRFCLCLVACVTVFSGIPSQTHETDEIRIALITAKTGEAGKGSALSFEAARFAVETMNASGGIFGHKVRLLEYDNRGTVEGSVMAVRKAIAERAVAVVGCDWSSHSLAMARVLEKARIPMITHRSTNEEVTRAGDCIFRICFTDSFQGSGLARFALNKLYADTAVVLVDVAGIDSMGLAKAFTDAFERNHGRVVWRGEYDSEALDVKAVLAETARHDPDVLFVPGGYADVAVLLDKVREYGIRSTIMSGEGIDVRLYDYIGCKAEGVYFASHWNRCLDTPKSRDFVSRYEKRFRVIPEDSQALVYDSFMVLKDAVERAGSFDFVAVRDALAATSDFQGVTGTITFDGYGDPIKPMVINRLKFGGVMFVDSVQP